MSDILVSKILLCTRSKPREAHVPERPKGFMNNRHVTLNKIRYCDRTKVVMKLLRPVYDSMIILWQ